MYFPDEKIAPASFFALVGTEANGLTNDIFLTVCFDKEVYPFPLLDFIKNGVYLYVLQQKPQFLNQAPPVG